MDMWLGVEREVTEGVKLKSLLRLSGEFVLRLSGEALLRLSGESLLRFICSGSFTPVHLLRFIYSGSFTPVHLLRLGDWLLYKAEIQQEPVSVSLVFEGTTSQCLSLCTIA